MIPKEAMQESPYRELNRLGELDKAADNAWDKIFESGLKVDDSFEVGQQGRYGTNVSNLPLQEFQEFLKAKADYYANASSTYRELYGKGEEQEPQARLYTMAHRFSLGQGNAQDKEALAMILRDLTARSYKQHENFGLTHTVEGEHALPETRDQFFMLGARDGLLAELDAHYKTELPKTN